MKRHFALVLTGFLLLSSIAFAENNEWTEYYATIDNYPKIVFDSTIYEGISGPPGGAMIKIEGIVWAEEKYPNHRAIYVKTDAGEKWVLSGLDLEDSHALLDRRIIVYGVYTGIAPVHTTDPDYGFLPSLRVIRYVLNNETINPKITETEFFFDNTMQKKYAGKYRYEVFEGELLEEIKDLMGGLFLDYEIDDAEKNGIEDGSNG